MATGTKKKGKKGSKTKKQQQKPASKQRAVTTAAVMPSKKSAGFGVLLAKAAESSLHVRVCGQLDAFCPHAVGQRIPDGNSTRTLTYQIRGSKILGTDASGMGALYFYPQYPYCVWTGGTSAAGVITLATAGDAPFPAAAALNTSGLSARFRVVTAGVKISSILNATANNGFVVVSSVSSQPQTITPPDLEALESIMTPLNQFKGQIWCAKRSSAVQSFNIPSVPTQGFPTTPGDYNGCVIQIVGPASTPSALLCEFVINIEILPLGDTIGPLIAQPTAPRNDAILQTTSKIMTKTAAVHSIDVTDFSAMISKVVNSELFQTVSKLGLEALPAFL